GPRAAVLPGRRCSPANAPTPRWTATAAGDAPLLPADLVAKMMRAVEGRPGAIALAQSHGELHPVIGLWPVALADDLEEQLRAGVRKVLTWTDRHGTIAVPFPPIGVCGLDIDPFFNATPPPDPDQLRPMLAKTATSKKGSVPPPTRLSAASPAGRNPASPRLLSGSLASLPAVASRLPPSS